MSERENFLSRWSKRKQAVAEAEKTATVGSEAGAEVPAAVEEDPFDPASLPSLDDLTQESDFSPFLRANVPEALRNAALRRLWALDPHLQGPDVLADYAWDFNVPEAVTGYGELAQGTDTQAMLRWIRGEETPPKPAPEEVSEETVGVLEEPSVDAASSDASEAEKNDDSNAAMQHQEIEIAEQFGNPWQNRRHGGALPN